MSLSEFPNLVGASLIECAVHWQQDVAEMLVGPLEMDAQAWLYAPHLRLRLHGLTQLDLPGGTSSNARVRAMHGPARTNNGTWRLTLELQNSRSLNAEFASSDIRGVFPGQVSISGADLFPRFQEVLRTTIQALVAGDLRSIRLFPGSGDHENILYHVHEYPTTLVHPPTNGYDEMNVLPSSSRDGVWHIDMPLWSPDGRNDLSILMEVRRDGDELIGYLTSIHVM